jgi:hypothetical protein
MWHLRRFVCVVPPQVIPDDAAGAGAAVDLALRSVKSQQLSVEQQGSELPPAWAPGLRRQWAALHKEAAALDPSLFVPYCHHETYALIFRCTFLSL